MQRPAGARARRDAGRTRPATEIRLGEPGWQLLLYTDGLIEGAAAPDASGGERLGIEGIVEVLRERGRSLPRDLPAWLAAQAEGHNGGPLSDDIAVLLLDPRSTE